jgi:hypothetical protein
MVFDDAAQHLLQGGSGPESFSVGEAGRNPADKSNDRKPGRNDFKGHAALRLWTNSRRVLRTAPDTSSSVRMPDLTMEPPSDNRRCRRAFPSFLLPAGFVTPNREPNHPHKVGETRSCSRQRRRLLHSTASSGRPNRAPIAAADSRRTQ